MSIGIKIIIVAIVTTAIGTIIALWFKALLKIAWRWFMNEWRLFCQNRRVKRKKKEYAKQISMLRAELWNYTKDLAIFFKIDENLCIYNVLKHSQMDDKKFLSKILILNRWFYFFYHRFNDIQDLAKLSEELVAIIRCWEQIYKDFCKELIKEKLAKSWLSFRNKYNSIIEQLNKLLKKVKQLYTDFVLQELCLLCDNPKDEPFIEE